MRSTTDIITTARAALETGPVCDWCLGRCFADRGTGMGVDERGWACRVGVAMATDAPYEPVEVAECWVCAGASAIDFDAWAERVMHELGPVSFETFQIGTRPPEEIIEHDRSLREHAALPPDAGLTFNAVVNAAIGDRIEARSDARTDPEHPAVVAVLDIVAERVEVQINPVYLYGRYRKLEPGIVQRVRQCPDCAGAGTVDDDEEPGSAPCDRCDGRGRLLSIEELLAWEVRDVLDASAVDFQTAGREGVEMLMLGTGRPFVLEIKEPKHRPADVQPVQDAIRSAAAGRVEVEGLAFAKPDIVGLVTQNPFRQRFELTVAFEDTVDAKTFEQAIETLDGAIIRRHLRLEDFEKSQRPHEVVRTLEDVIGTWLDDRSATIEFEVEAGIDPGSIATGDDGETTPSLADLVETPVEVTQVAVVSVEGREEPFENPAYLLASSDADRE